MFLNSFPSNKKSQFTKKSNRKAFFLIITLPKEFVNQFQQKEKQKIFCESVERSTTHFCNGFFKKRVDFSGFYGIIEGSENIGV